MGDRPTRRARASGVAPRRCAAAARPARANASPTAPAAARPVAGESHAAIRTYAPSRALSHLDILADHQPVARWLAADRYWQALAPDRVIDADPQRRRTGRNVLGDRQDPEVQQRLARPPETGRVRPLHRDAIPTGQAVPLSVQQVNVDAVVARRRG